MATLSQKMLVGLNQNVTFRGRTYHVQTEDCGLDNPQLVTHLFSGGSILASKKSSYSPLVGEPDVEQRVQRLMEQQHTAMLRDLVEGEIDLDEAEAKRHQPGGPASHPPAGNLIDGKTLDEVILGHLTAQIGK